YELLANPIYLGEIRHRKLRHPGQHPAIVDRAVWEQVQERLRKQAVHHRTLNAKGVSSPLAGKLFDENDEPLYTCGANKGERHYRYYVSRKVIRGSTARRGSGWRLPALQIERAVQAPVGRCSETGPRSPQSCRKLACRLATCSRRSMQQTR